MTNQKRKVGVFTAGCSVCDPAVKIVKELECPSCEVKVYDLNKGCETGECKDKAKKYGITKIPAVVVDGKVCLCCDNNVINKKDLQEAGVGQPL